ncbi:hypothetical protein [Ramlibacter sp.]|uniref:hypothetical protein n=1 Tax=Ramlibacter sp. TaxID=1917967 RepID=UPI00184AF691|nr:hypothetical protein [Ramlibacter sp.]MBA2675543.1 hypothetical protein [Ramlibacter sp.]
MQRSLELLDAALRLEPLPYWYKELGLQRSTLTKARERGNLSPAVAGALAEKLGENVDRWIAIAALEGEKDSACKERMLKRYRRVERAMGIEPTS